MSGYVRLTDLRSPAASTVVAQRMRMPPSQIAFCSSIMSFITVDEIEMVKAYPLRRFFAPVYISKMPATPTAVSTGAFHSCVAMGCADGSTLVTNPIRKIAHPKVPAASITVWRYEWKRQGRGREGEEREGDKEEGQVNGVGRWTEGYKVDLTPMSHSSGKPAQDDKQRVGVIWEEMGQVKSVAWNSGRVDCGGWLACAMGSGLVRVQDTATDHQTD